MQALDGMYISARLRREIGQRLKRIGISRLQFANEYYSLFDYKHSRDAYFSLCSIAQGKPFGTACNEPTLEDALRLSAILYVFGVNKTSPLISELRERCRAAALPFPYPPEDFEKYPRLLNGIPEFAR